MSNLKKKSKKKKKHQNNNYDEDCDCDNADRWHAVLNWTEPVGASK